MTVPCPHRLRTAAANALAAIGEEGLSITPKTVSSILFACGYGAKEAMTTMARGATVWLIVRYLREETDGVMVHRTRYVGPGVTLEEVERTLFAGDPLGEGELAVSVGPFCRPDTEGMIEDELEPLWPPATRELPN